MAPAVLSGTGVIVGAGIYALIGQAAGKAGGATWLAFLLAAAVAGLTAASYARMGKRIPKDSPEFQYTRAGLGGRAGFMAGWLMVSADLVSTAAVALGFGGYLQALVGTHRVLAAVGLAALLSLVAWVGIRQSVLLVSLMSVAEIGGLVVVVALGLPHWGEHALLEAPQGLTGVWTAAALIFFAYIGFDELGNLAEEMRRPERDLQRSIILAMAISTILYLLVAISSVSLVGWQALAASPAPLADAVEGVLGPSGRTTLALVALASTANTVLLLLIAASRSLYGMAQAGVLPGALGRVGRRHTPWVSTLTVFAVVSSFLLIGDIALVAQVANFATLAAFGMVNLSLAVILRREARGRGRDRARRPLIARLAILQPALALGACLWLAALTGALAIGAGLLILLLGLGLERWLGGRADARQRGAPREG